MKTGKIAILGVMLLVGIFTMAQLSYALRGEAPSLPKAKQRIERKAIKETVFDVQEAQVQAVLLAIPQMAARLKQSKVPEIQALAENPTAVRIYALREAEVINNNRKNELLDSAGITEFGASAELFGSDETAVGASARKEYIIKYLAEAVNGQATLQYEGQSIGLEVAAALRAVYDRKWLDLQIMPGEEENQRDLSDVRLNVVAFNGASVRADNTGLIDRINKLGEGEIPVIIARDKGEYDRLMDRSEETGIREIRRKVYVTLIEEASVWDAIFQGQDFISLSKVNTSDLLNANLLRDLATAK